MKIWDEEWEVEVRRTIIGGWLLLFLLFSSFDKTLSFSFPTDFSCVSSPVFRAN